jgi:hypothetical protein
MTHPFSSANHTMDVSCLYSTVKNISGRPMVFGFLPPHGRKLAVDEEFTVFGDIKQAVIKDVERVTSRRHILAFEAAIDRGDLEIINTPSPILQDQSSGLPKMLQLDTTLSVVDPCWHNSVS